MRKTILNWHLYVSLITGVFLLVICVTGCLLVFELRMDRWLDPTVSYVHPGAGRVSYTNIQARLNAAFPGAAVTEYDIGGPNESVIAKLGPEKTTFRAFVDPYSGRILGTRQGEPPSYWVRHIHRELAAGTVGTQLVRITSFVALFQALSGLYLWWPLKRASIEWTASWRRINVEFHHVAGFFSSAFIFLIALTGLVKGYGDALQPVFDRMTGISAGNKALLSAAPADPSHARRITMDDALATAQQQLPGAFAARLTPPKDPRGSYLVTMKFPGDSTVPGRSWVVVDQYSGRILASQDTRTAPLSAQIPIVNRAIHVGGIYGIPTRILAFLTALVLPLQLVTGILIWWRKRPASRVPARVREDESKLIVNSSAR